MKTQEKPLILKGNRKLFEPTGKALLEQLQDIRLIVIRQGGKTIRYLPDNMETKRRELSIWQGMIGPSTCRNIRKKFKYKQKFLRTAVRESK